MSQKQKASSEKKLSIVLKCKRGELGISEAARIAGVDFKAIKQWINRYEAEGREAFAPHQQKG